MKALIIAGGPGLRLRPKTKKNPKSLIRVGSQPILGRIIDSLLENEVGDLTIITGYLENQIKDFVISNYPDIKPIFFTSPNTKISYLYPMWLVRRFLKDDDILYLHGDLFYDPALVRKLLDFPQSAALVNKNFVPQKDFKARVEDGLITKIGVNVFGKGAGFCLPLYKFLKDDFELWMEQIGKFVENNNLDCYAEDALNEILDKIKFYPIYFDKELGMEIDDLEDLKKAKEMFSDET